MSDKIAVLVPCYKRPEYTDACLNSIYSAQKYENVTFYLIDDGWNKEIVEMYAREKDIVSVHESNVGLRNSIIEFIDWVLKDSEFDIIAKVDNDCLVPKNWLTDLVTVLKNANADIISPNTSETNAAHRYGAPHMRDGDFIPSKIVGGLWCMKTEMLDDIYFEKSGTTGIRGAFHIINQIVSEKEPKIGWTDKVTFQDIGYWTGSHPAHIKSQEHAIYSAEIGRPITWRPTCQ